MSERTDIRNLSHKPMFYFDYQAHDGPYAGNTDCIYLSLGWAQYDPRSASLKTWRYSTEGKRWSRQSEELPLHRAIDAVILLALAIDAMKGHHLDNIHLDPNTFENQMDKPDIQAGVESSEAFAREITNKLVLRRLRKLREILNRMHDEKKLDS